MSAPPLALPVSPAQVAAFLERTEEAGAGPGGRPELAELAARFAGLPAEPGSVVVLALPNGLRLVSAFFAVLLAGHCPVLLSPATPAPRIRQVARHLGAAALLRARIDPAECGTGAVSQVAGADLATFGGHGWHRHAPGQVILMTSGTSGFATGCLHGLDALLRNATRHAAAVGLRPADTVLVNLPAYYSFALVAQVLASLVTGCRLVLTGPPFSVGGYAAAIAGHEVTVSSLTPVLAKSVLADPQHGALPAPLRMLTVGGQALAPAHTAALLRANPGLELYLTYGLTEAGPRVSTLAAHAEPAHRHGSVGRPLSGVDLLLAEPGADGERELLVRSDTVCRRRVGEAPASARGRLVEPGLLGTGDVGHLDADGYLTVRGRSSDFVLVRGEKVSLAGVRRAAESLPGVVRAAARVTGEAAEPVLELDVYLDAGAPAEEAAVLRQLRSVLNPGERPRLVRLHPLAPGEFHK